MCPFCIGSALLAATGAGSAGGLALIAARVLGAGSAKHSRDAKKRRDPAAQNSALDEPSAREPDR